LITAGVRSAPNRRCPAVDDAHALEHGATHVTRGRRVTRLWPIAIGLAIGAAALRLGRAPSDLPPIKPPPRAIPEPIVAPFKISIPFEDAKPILDAHRDELPAELKGKSAAELRSAWPGWVARHNAEIRARLERGDEDSIVNFWLYGTTFTRLPRATQQGLAKRGDRSRAEDVLIGRLNDLVEGMASPGAPGANDRLRFARQVIERHGIDPTTEAGKEQARVYLVQARERVIAENSRQTRTAQSATRLTDRGAKLAAYATLYADRGLSSDTSLSADFALDHAFEKIKAEKRLAVGSVRRVAIVGPGLDFTDKAEGYDFYPQQTIQPFAVIDSLIRLELAQPDDLRVTTFDLSPRVNQHLEAAIQRARSGEAYVLQLPLAADDSSHQWNPNLVKYWKQFGGAIGDETPAMAPPSNAGTVRVRAVRVRPEVVRSIVPRDVNIVLERLEALRADDRFDVIVATNILVYYDAFEQALALANVSAMLRPGGFFLTNYAVFPTAPMDSSASLITTVDFDRQHNGDTLFWYQRR
jgi:hypothetical protein